MEQQKHKAAFVDYSKTEEGKLIFEKNQQIWKDGNFFQHIRSLKDPKEIEIAQLIRRYQSSFSWIHKGVDHIKAFQIRHTPTCRPEDLGDFEIKEGYLWLEILVPEKYPSETASFVLLNQSFPNPFKRAFEKELLDNHIETRSITKTLKYMDNNLDKIVQKILLDLARIEKLKSEPRAVEPKVKKENNTEEAHKPDGKEGQKQAQNQEEHKNDGEWTQELQTKLEKAIVKYKDIKDPKEKWQKIAEEVPGKTMNDCVQRFKECRRIAEEKKQAELAKEAQRKQSSSGKSSSEEEDESEERSGEESGSDEFDVDDETDSEEEAKGTDRRKQVDMYEDEGCLLSMVVAKNLRLENISIGKLTSLQAQVSCKNCGCIHEAEANIATGDYLINQDKCPKCNSNSRLVVKPEIFHKDSAMICKIGSYTWDIRDIHFCEYELNCEFCNTANKSKKVISGQTLYLDCFGCFKKTEFSYIALSVLPVLVGEDEDDEENTKHINPQDIMKRIFGKKNRGEFKVGNPLPNNGACKHYKNSHRFFRFPCCGKAYPCDDCHNKVEKHDMERAKNMICGYCSSEQPISDTCRKCQKAVVKITEHTAYWEGGKGTRNRITMSSKDPHKYKGLAKTVSKKKRNENKKKK